MEEITGIEIRGVYFEMYHGDCVALTIECEHPDATHHGVYGVLGEGYAEHMEDFSTYSEARNYAESYNLPIWESR